MKKGVNYVNFHVQYYHIITFYALKYTFHSLGPSITVYSHIHLTYFIAFQTVCVTGSPKVKNLLAFNLQHSLPKSCNKT